jgi:redox-sensitive bicupin YhaK (pirin superfamily)
MKKTILKIVDSQPVRMGHIEIGQPIPQGTLDEVSPFILLHHAEPRVIPPGGPAFDVAPHPHRGFEPVTFVFQGEVEHRDSRGNHGIVGTGGVQWITAGMGIIHSESSSQSFIDTGGNLEIIQVWINLPKALKMVQPNYQMFNKTEIPVIEQTKGKINVISGNVGSTHGPIQSLTHITALTVEMQANGKVSFDLPENHNGVIYQLSGDTNVNGTSLKSMQLLQLDSSGTQVEILSDTNSKLLVLSGNPIDEPKKMWGPYVMNTQTEIMEALRDYDMGKMGFLAR